MPVSLRGRLDAVFMENVGDSASANLMSQISERAADARISPRAILERHAQNEIHDRLCDARPARPTPLAVVPFRCHQYPVPSQQGVRCDQRFQLVNMQLEPLKRLTDPKLKSLLAQPRTTEEAVPDGSVPGLRVRFFPGGAANWTLALRVTGEGGVNAHGKPLLGRKIRVSLGNYPQVSLQAARAQANHLIEQAKRGINPKIALAQSATAYTMTVRQLSEKYLKDYVHSKGLDSAKNYELAFATHINPVIGELLAALVTREDTRNVMNAARVKRPRPKGQKGGQLGGIEAARTTMSVLRQMYSWAIDESVLKRQDNPASRMQKNLPKQKRGETVLTLREARIVWHAAKDCG